MSCGRAMARSSAAARAASPAASAARTADSARSVAGSYEEGWMRVSSSASISALASAAVLGRTRRNPAQLLRARRTGLG